MNSFALSGLLTGISSSVLALVVYFKAPKHMPNRMWVLFSLAVTMWGLGSYRIALATTPDAALTWWKLTHIGIILIPPLFLHFICLFLNIQRQRMIAAMYGLAAFFIVTTFATTWMIRDMRLVFGSFYYDSPPGPLYPLFVLCFFATIFYAHIEMYRAYKLASGQKRDQLRYFFLATACGFSGGSTAFLPVFGWDIYPILNFTVPLYPVIMSYAIVRYRLMDITVILNRSLAYALLLTGIMLATTFGMLLSTRATTTTAPPLVVALLVALCGVAVFTSNRRAATNLSLASYCAALAVWLFGAFMVTSAPSQGEALQWARAVYAGLVFVPALFFHFCMRLIGDTAATRRIRTLYGLSILFLFLVPTPWLITTPYRYSFGYYQAAGLLHPLFLVYFFTTVAAGLGNLYKAYRINAHYGTDEATRLKYSFWAFTVGVAAGVDFLPSYGYEIYPAGSLVAALWLAIMAYAIARHSVVDVSLPHWHTHRALYLQSLSLLAAMVAVAVTLRWFTQRWDFALTGALLAVFMVFAGFLANLPRSIESVLGRQLLRDRYDAYETIVQFSQSLVSIIELQSLANEIVRTLTRTMGSATAALYVLDQEKHLYTRVAEETDATRSPSPATLTRDNPLPQTLTKSRTLLLRGELSARGQIAPHPTHPVLLATMDAIHADACFPLSNKDRLIGILTLGPRHDGTAYSSDDLSLLTTLSHHAAIALDNALLYEDLRRSEAMMRRTDRLRSLETIAGGFAHEVRNPLTSIKTFVQLVPDRRDDREFVDEFSLIVAEDVNRIERLVQEIMDYARYMEPQLTVQDLNEVVTSCLYFIEMKATARGVKIVRNLAMDLPPVTLDRQQIKQVLLNLFINALDAMKDRNGHLGVTTHRLTKADNTTWVQIEVADTGAGIPQEQLEQIFDPFFSTKHTSQDREGTGLGLTIVHQIVREHRGYIEVVSEVGRGTTVYVNLPATPEDAGRAAPEPTRFPGHVGQPSAGGTSAQGTKNGAPSTQTSPSGMPKSVATAGSLQTGHTTEHR
ncbi:MAG: ATP-binding protein [Nitrospiraceae bacterium]